MDEKYEEYLLEDAYVKINKTGDRVNNIAFACYFLFGCIIAFQYGTFKIAFGVGGLCLAMYYGTKFLLPKSSFYQYIGSVIVALFSAQFIYQMHGMFEMHFFVFIGATLLIAYQNWRLQLPNIIVVVIHHGIFAYLQYKGNAEIYFTQQTYMDLETFLFHGALAAVVVLICGYWAYILERKTKREMFIKAGVLQQVNNIRHNIEFADAISQGNLAAIYTIMDDKDELGKSLLKMQASLTRAQKKDMQDKFMTLGLAQMGEILRNSSDIQSLSYEIISHMVKYLKANQGGIFILQDKESDPYLELTACYAYDRKKYLKKRIEIGEGLIGQVVLEKDTIFLTDIPNDYVHITSGLGKANPGCILIVPLKLNDEVEGALELASFNVFEKHEIGLVEKLAESIASAVSATRTNENTKKLLEELKQQTEMLRSQEEEMRQNMEELAATQEEMERRQAEMEEMRIEEVTRLQNRIKELEEQLKV
ncbi:GAF domain-containing protein [Cytophagaceae bacterium YF14B1]|uniref:GAF domain-containing protein n=1 Tax=Xanthocytophaga flava TaxID=3048013 RepID=A0AAE3U7U5_9BACT|nr:GAF domain-containing protein [Xanthocytophaga flavus]MDJ1480498.1 GAF domain-containing protein [Xanthocytophaga flavus]